MRNDTHIPDICWSIHELTDLVCKSGLSTCTMLTVWLLTYGEVTAYQRQ
jgi:hypothetical protein